MGVHIDREQALSHPFANGKYDHEHANEHFILGFESYREWLEGLPTIDLVTCGECIHFHYDKPYIIQGIPVLGHEVCDFWGDGCKTNPNGFCSHGERREDL